VIIQDLECIKTTRVIKTKFHIKFTKVESTKSIPLIGFINIIEVIILISPTKLPVPGKAMLPKTAKNH
jgi:hypothetical protein